jgi:hypothetical protein
MRIHLRLSWYILFFIGGVIPANAAYAQTNGLQKYFQQHVEYTIEVRLDDENHYLLGEISFVYHNQSDSALRRLYFHLWPNAYKNRKTSFCRHQLENDNLNFYYAPKKKRGYIDSLQFTVEGKKANWSFITGDHPLLNTIEGDAFARNLKEITEIAAVELPQPLLPGQKITLQTPFRVKLPQTFSRLGHIERQYQITQWYPKPVVFDTYGWRPMPYLDQGEFYSEWGKFTVAISLPSQYKIAATGVLQKQTPDPLYKSNTIYRYFADSVHDFAWFCDPDYIIDQDTLQLPGSHRIIRVQALYKPEEKKYWQKATQYIKEAIYWYSQLVGEYPYPQATAVSAALGAGGGMEYPMITVIGNTSGASTLRRVIVHEIGHNWFYGILASNERLHPWLDEGLNSYYENRIMDILEGKTTYTPDLPIKQKFQTELKRSQKSKILLTGDLTSTPPLTQLAYKFAESTGRIQPLNLPANWYTKINYGLIVYTKSVFALNFLENYLGQQQYDNCMKAYFEQWKFKHPYPKDLKNVFEQTSQKDLAWFFDGLLNTKRVIDFKIKNVERRQNRLHIAIQNKSGLLLPAAIAIQDEKQQIIELLQTEPFLEEKTIIWEESSQQWHSIVINPAQVLPERKIHNNSWRNRAFLPAWPGVQLKALYQIENIQNKFIFWLPALGGNASDGFMLGGLFYFQPYPRKNFEFHLLPMYAFASQRLTGSAGFTLRAFPQEIFRKIEWKTRAAQFSDLFRLKNAITFYFQPWEKALTRPQASTENFYRKEPNWRSKTINYITLRTHQIAQYDGNEWQTYSSFRPYFTALDWHYSRDKTLWEAGFDYEFGFHSADAIRMSLAPYFNYRYTKNAFVSLRGFLGKWLVDKNVPFPLAFRFNGSGDPLGENILLDRNRQTDGILSRQLVNDMGGFRSLMFENGKHNAPEPFTDQWLTALNFTLQAPSNFFNFLHLFVDFGAAPSAASEKIRREYAAGVGFYFGKGLFNINYPIIGSFYPDTFPHSWKAFGERINFSFEINKFLQKLDL